MELNIMELNIKDLRRVAAGRYWLKYNNKMGILIALAMVWFLFTAVAIFPEASNDDTIYIQPNAGIEAVRPYGENYLIVDEVVWLRQEKEESHKHNYGGMFLIALAPLLTVAIWAMYIAYKQEDYVNSFLDENTKSIG